MVERASPAQLRKALELANLFVKIGVNFVPVPVANDEEQQGLVEQALSKLAEIEQAAEQGQTKGSANTVPRSLTRCAAGRDGECRHDKCPQLRDGEPTKSGRHCPLDNDTEDDNG